MHRLLIVDDEDSIRFSLRAYFETQGFVADCANNLEQVEALLEKGKYTVAISDLRLDGQQSMSGLEVINLIHRRHPDTLIVVLSAYKATEVEQQATERGISAYLRKPKPLPDLAQIIFGLLAETAPDRLPNGSSETSH
jgi:DNA-binding NtrC family response regulator